MAFESGGGGGGLSRANSSRAAASYQNAGDSAWAGMCSRVEDELRRFTALSSQLKKGVDLVGTARDSEEVRARITAAMERGKDSVADISNLLKTKLADAASADEATLSAKERTARTQQQQRFQRDWSTASGVYSDTLKLWQSKARQHPAPAKAAGGGGGKASKAYPSVGSSSSTTSKAEEEASCVCPPFFLSLPARGLSLPALLTRTQRDPAPLFPFSGSRCSW